ncbi:MAG: hypothetical protein ACPIOQ_21925 [Promethearchaeia archaeon]
MQQTSNDISNLAQARAHQQAQRQHTRKAAMHTAADLLGAVALDHAGSGQPVTTPQTQTMKVASSRKSRGSTEEDRSWSHQPPDIIL